MKHTAIRASAGAGKTYQLSTRFVALLERGERIDQLLASTFSRKAAGEIILRVLERLVERSDRALLSSVVKQIHRMRIGTLDAFFMALVQSFGLELGFSPSWHILDEALDKALKRKAVAAALLSGGAALGPHIIALQKGQTRRAIVGVIEEHVEALMPLYLDAPPAAWNFVPEGIVPPRFSLEEVTANLLAVPLQKPSLQNARDSDVAAARARDYLALVTKGISAKVLRNESVYQRSEIPAELVRHYHALHAIVRFWRGQQLLQETQALYALLGAVAKHYSAYKRVLDGYGFDDIARTLARTFGAKLSPEVLSDVFYRLDSRIHHLLLDEFQDTSLAQWQVLEPIAREIVSHADGSRSFFVVGDVKQAIYGWRGGVSEIFDRVTDSLPGIERLPLDESRRSSPVIMDFINRVFGALSSNAALADYKDAAQAWSFSPQRTVHKDMAGHVRVSFAPRNEDDQPGQVLRAAADDILRLRHSAPQASIGVLVRSNNAVRRLIWELSQRQVPASEEGGNPLTDSPAVQLILSLLNIGDHPAHRIARYHVAQSPLGEALGYRDHADNDEAYALSERVRRSVVEQGYGHSVRHYASLLSPHVDARNARRLGQLAELALRYDAQANHASVDLLRTQAFIAFVRETKIEEPLPAAVRVMTIHQSKGLEFDIAVVCNIDERLTPRHTSLAMERETPLSPPQRIFRTPSKAEWALFPELGRMSQGAANAAVKERLSNLYVALTRPKHAMHVILTPDTGKTLSAQVGNVVRAALCPKVPLPAGAVFYEAGDADWARKVQWTVAATPPEARAPQSIRLRAPKHFLVRATASGLEGGMRVDVKEHLRLERRPGLERGALVHAWLETVSWLEEGVPAAAALRAVYQRCAPHLDFDTERVSFERLLQAPAMQAQLSRARFASMGANLRVYREMPFAVREGRTLLTGSFDRVVVRRRNDESALWILDWKTDRIEDESELQRRVAYYKPQLEAYRRAAETVFRVPKADIRCELVFLGLHGRTIEV